MEEIPFQHCQILMLMSSCFHSEKVHAEMNPPIPKPDYRSTTHKDFCVEGFVPLTPETTQVSVYMYLCTLYMCMQCREQ